MCDLSVVLDLLQIKGPVFSVETSILQFNLFGGFLDFLGFFDVVCSLGTLCPLCSSPSLIFQLLAPSVPVFCLVSNCSRCSLPSLCFSLALMYYLGIPVPLIILYCLLHLLFFCPGSPPYAFSQPDFSSLVFTLCSAFYEPMIQHHTSSPSVFCLLSVILIKLLCLQCFAITVSQL